MTPRIEICGNIASGKTTLCHFLAKKGCHPIFEDFTNNPFIAKFYDEPSIFSFETELTFLLLHYHAIKLERPDAVVVCDYSLILDLAYADVNLSGDRHRLFSEIVSELQNEIGYPSRIIYLFCSEEVLIQRIRARARVVESSIRVDYLRALNKAISLRIRDITNQISVTSIDSHVVDFRRGIDEVPELYSLAPAPFP
ncbi:MAG: deoxynucleoside kinase [Syntrophobacteraceae bacterium]|nr:deoxynucleoside kinase [Syntrophobacteraceae bacterium]